MKLLTQWVHNSVILSFIHSLSGRDITSYPYFTGKTAWLAASNLTDIENLEDFADEAKILQLQMNPKTKLEIFLLLYLLRK